MTFNIDANGILHVLAKDLGTGKEQSIRITPSSGLSEDEIKKMQKDAEAHAEDDKKEERKDRGQEPRGHPGLSTEKAMKEYGDKVDADTKKGNRGKARGLEESPAGRRHRGHQEGRGGTVPGLHEAGRGHVQGRGGKENPIAGRSTRSIRRRNGFRE